MTYTTKQIETETRENFQKIYKAFGDFTDSGELWDACIAALRDKVLMSHIIFCNDIHKIPPVDTLLRADKFLSRRKFTEREKRFIGAFWCFVFKSVFGYCGQKRTSVRALAVRTATYFFDIDETATIK
ncbi:MAG: hypothetical protein LBN00_09560 [Oscillospiraceae bacterium]|jgi:hypothetical protein|nr:hypothetical protein [Oscillospiraceae bacterium]